MKIKLNGNIKINYTLIENDFLDSFVYLNHTFSIIYIILLRLYSENKEISFEILKNNYNISSNDFINAIEFLEKNNLIKITKFESDEIILNFLNKKVDNSTDNRISNKNNEYIKNMHNFPKYTEQEINLYRTKSEQIDKLFFVAEKHLGRLLKYDEVNIIFSFYDWLKLPIDVINLLLENCSKNNKKNIRYIEKIAIDWSEKNLNTVEKVQNYLNSSKNEYKEILKAFGQNNRQITKLEMDFINKWIYELKIPLDEIIKACEKTLINTGKAQYSYAEKILLKSKENIKNNNFKNQKRNKFANFEPRKIDWSLIRNYEEEYLRMEAEEDEL